MKVFVAEGGRDVARTALYGSVPLRAADAVHRASALLVSGGDPTTTVVACFDVRLRDAAQAASFAVTPTARLAPG